MSEYRPPNRITYNPGYKVTYEDEDPSRGYIYQLTFPAAAPTFTAADLERAWGMGRDEAARAVHEAGRMTLGHLNAIGGLTPPADLAQRVKGPAHDRD